MGDISSCFEMTAAYGGFYRFNSGKIGVGFDTTGGSDKLISGDPTAGLNATVFNLEYATLNCTSGSINLVDGSAGTSLFGIVGSDLGNSNSQVWDFRDDPLRCLTADSTVSLCISAANGFVSGFVKGYWGPKGL